MTIKEFNQLYKNFNKIKITKETSVRLKPLSIEFPSEIAQQQLFAKIKATVITKEQAIRDIEDFFLAIKYCYSGYEYFSKFINFNTIKQDIITLITNWKNKYISAIELGELLFTELSPHINDGHFSLVGFGNCAKLWRAYVTDIVVELSNREYRVIKGNDKLPIGTVIDKQYLTGKLLPTLVVGNSNDCFLVGIYSKEKLDYINVGGLQLNTHIIRADVYGEQTNNYHHKYEEYDDYNILYSKSYNIVDSNQDILNEYNNFGLKSRAKPVMIFDIAGNRGGNSRFPQSFIEGLNDYAYWQTACATLQNPLFKQDINYKTYAIRSILKDYDYSQSKYNGTLYVVMNKWTISSGESAVLYAKSCKRRICIGSATGGIGEFGDVKFYKLPNSHLIFYFGHKIFHMKDYDEGRGFLPDYWIDSDNIVAYLQKYLKSMDIIKSVTNNQRVKFKDII